MEGSCAKDFGKEIGMVHEGIITLRGQGLTAAGWEKMKDDKDLARKVVEIIEGKKDFWLEQILARERACHLAFFGKEFDLSYFAFKLKKHGESKIRFWQKLGLEPHFLPAISMSQSDNYPGWKVKPEAWFYQKIAEGRIKRDAGGELKTVKETKLEDISVLMDTRLKPKYNDGKQMYENDNLLGPIIQGLRKEKKIAKYEYGPQDSRFGVSANEIEAHIKRAFAEKTGLNEVRLETVSEANAIPQIYTYMPRKDDGKTDTWILYEEYLDDRDYRLHGGNSDYGGLANVSSNDAGGHWHHRSFRLLAVL